MRIFMTGASGFIGSSVVPELLGAGHQLSGLARSERSAAALEAAGVTPVRGDLNDLDVLRAGAEHSDGVIHLAFIHDFSQMAAAADTDRQAIGAFGEALAGTNRPLVIASGVLGLVQGRPVTEQDGAGQAAHPRVANAQATLALAERGVRSSVIRFAPTVHGQGDHGFMHTLIEVARQQGASAYVGDGSSRWPAVHVNDAAALVRLAAEQAPAGSVLHAVAEAGVPTREIAAAIGRHLDLPVISVPAEGAADHFGWIGRFFALDAVAASAHTRELLGWQPTHPGLLADLDAGHYFQR